MSNKPTGKRPNIIWIFGDQHRGQAMGCAGDPNARTPNLDAMAADSLMFPNAVSGSPICCPFRGTLLTGIYPHKCVPVNGVALPEGQATISTVLRQAGYHTCYLGKWHLAGERRYGGPKKLVPEDQRADFDEWIGYDNINDPWNTWVHGGLGDDFFHQRLDGFVTDKLTDMLVERLESWGKAQAKGNGKPFFATLSVMPPHDPYTAPEEFMKNYSPANISLRPNVPLVDWVREKAQRQLAGYYAMIENLDWNVGRIRNAIQANGLYDNTIIVFFSDHGDMQGSRGRFFKNAPYEESIRIPFLISGKAEHFNRGRTFDSVINHVDIAPTTLGLCGVDVPDFMEGFDYSGYWRGDWRKNDNHQLDNEPQAAYLQNCENHSLPEWRAIVTRDGWKYAVVKNTPWLLFNTCEDPYETMNGAFNSHFHQERHHCHQLLKELMEKCDDEFALPDIETKEGFGF